MQKRGPSNLCLNIFVINHVNMIYNKKINKICPIKFYYLFNKICPILSGQLFLPNNQEERSEFRFLDSWEFCPRVWYYAESWILVHPWLLPAHPNSHPSCHSPQLWGPGVYLDRGVCPGEGGPGGKAIRGYLAGNSGALLWANSRWEAVGISLWPGQCKSPEQGFFLLGPGFAKIRCN